MVCMAVAPLAGQPINTAPGPEDMVLSLSGSPRIIISCGDFFKPHQDKRQHAIYYYDINDNRSAEFEINGLPKDLEFFPHGITLDKNQEKLYVIYHDQENSKRNNGIAIFDVEGTQLLFNDTLTSTKFLKTPNDLTVTDDGTLYITNEGGFGLWDIVSRLFMRRSFIARYDPVSKSFSRAFRKTVVANGIHSIGDKVYIADSFKKKLMVTQRQSNGSLKLTGKIKVAKNMDNITQDGDKLYIASHFSGWKLKKARSRSNVRARFCVHTIDLVSGEVNMIIEPGNDLPINAVSTALSYNGHLYLSQIFGDFILKVK